MPLLVLLALPAQAALMLATPQPLMPGATMSHALPTQRSRAAALIFGVVMCADRDNFRFGTGRPGNPFWNRRLYGGTRCVALATTASSELSASPTRTRSQAASVKRSFGGPAEFKSSFDFRPRLLLHMNMNSRPPILCSYNSECCACRYGSGCPGSPFSNPRAFGGPDGVTFLAAAAAAPPEQPAQPRVEEEEEAVKEEEAVWVGAS